MANDTVSNPWKLDTAAVITTNPIKIKAMEWRPVTAVGDDLLVSANDGSEIYLEKAIAVDANGQIAYYWALNGEGMSCNGFNLETIDSGTLKVWRA